jgi:dsDNA-specific endonuclease/ATPase MutS2
MTLKMRSAGFSAEDELEGKQPHPIPLEDCLDLHTFSPRDVASLTEEYLLCCRDAGFSEVRIIHGRGSGIQRRTVRAVLSRLPFVKSFYDAPPQRGGWGATIVHLQLADELPSPDPEGEG